MQRTTDSETTLVMDYLDAQTEQTTVANLVG